MAYRSSSIGTPANSTSWTVPVPAGLANGDKVNIFLIAEAGYFDAATPPSGFTLDTTEAETASDFRPVYLRRYFKDITDAAGEGSGGNYTFTFGSAMIGYAVAVAHSGRASGAGTDAATNDGAAGASPLSVPLTGVTAASGDDVIALWSLAPADSDTGASSNTAPTNYTARQNLNNLWRIAQLATRDNVSAGATGTLTASSTFATSPTARYTGLVVTLPAGSSAPTISSGTPTGTVGGNNTLSFTSSASSGPFRIVVDSAANLSGVTNTQVAAGQKANGSAAAYDSGTQTASSTTPSYAFNGLPSGTYTAAAVHDGSTVLTWTFTVDSSPSAFSFTDQTDVAVSSVRTSNSITVTGLGGTTPVSISGGEYRKNGGSWVTAAGTVVNDDTIEVRHTSSASYNTVTNTVLTIGDSSDTFTSTTPAITLSSPTATSGTTSTASGTVSTTVDTGTIYTVASTSATAPTGPQIEAGDMHTGADAAGAASPLTVTAAGSQNLSLSGLPQGTTLYLHSVHKVGSQYSNIATSAAFTTRGIGSVDGDNIVVEGQTGVIVAGRFGSTTPVARIKSGSFSATQTVTANSTSSITVSPIARGSLPYTDANHTHLLEIDTDE